MFGIDDLALAVIGSAVLSSAGSAYANRQNKKMQQSNNDTSIELANTAHQREIADLKAAGLNPILSANGAGSSVPSLGVAEQSNVLAGIADGMSTAANIQMERPKVQSQIDVNTATAKNLEVQNDNLKKQNELIDAQIADTYASAAQKGANVGLLKEKAISERYPGIFGSAYKTLMSSTDDIKNGTVDFFTGKRGFWGGEKDSSTSTSAKSLNTSSVNPTSATGTNSASTMSRYDKAVDDLYRRDYRKKRKEEYEKINKRLPIFKGAL